MPPSPGCWRSLYGPAWVPGPSAGRSWATVGPGSRKLPASSWERSRASTKPRKPAAPAQAASRNAAPSAVGRAQRQQLLVGPGGGGRGGVQGDARPSAAVAEGLFAAGVVDEDAAHGLGRGGEEVAAAVPGAVRVRPAQPQVGLVDERGRVQR